MANFISTLTIIMHDTGSINKLMDFPEITDTPKRKT